MDDRRPFASLMYLENSSEYIARRDNEGTPIEKKKCSDIGQSKKRNSKKIKQRKKKNPGKENFYPDNQTPEKNVHPDESFRYNSLIESSDRRCVNAYAADIYTYLLTLEVPFA